MPKSANNRGGGGEAGRDSRRKGLGGRALAAVGQSRVTGEDGAKSGADGWGGGELARIVVTK